MRKQILEKMNYNAIMAEVNKGRLSIRELEQRYKKQRKILNDRSLRISKAGNLSFEAFGQERPRPETLKEIKALEGQYVRNLAKAMSDINMQISRKSSTLGGRRAQVFAAVKTLREERGLSYINESNYGTWVQFSEYINSLSKEYGFYILSDEAEDAFIEGTSRGNPVGDINIIINLFHDFIGM